MPVPTAGVLWRTCIHSRRPRPAVGREAAPNNQLLGNVRPENGLRARLRRCTRTHLSEVLEEPWKCDRRKLLVRTIFIRKFTCMAARFLACLIRVLDPALHMGP